MGDKPSRQVCDHDQELWHGAEDDLNGHTPTRSILVFERNCNCVNQPDTNEWQGNDDRLKKL